MTAGVIDSVQRVDFDQNAWIEPAQSYYGVPQDDLTREALEAVQESIRLGVASYPLSWIHYLKTYRSANSVHVVGSDTSWPGHHASTRSREHVPIFRMRSPLQWRDFMARANTRMRMTAHQNAKSSWDVRDFDDKMGLGCAAAYCDVVVAEKKWGDILKRHRKHLAAHVITSVKDLPRLLRE